MGYIKWMDENPKWLKIVLALPIINILWEVYRLVKSIEDDNVLGIVLAVILIIFGGFFMWLLDIITLAVNEEILWF